MIVIDCFDVERIVADKWYFHWQEGKEASDYVGMIVVDKQFLIHLDLMPVAFGKLFYRHHSGTTEVRKRFSLR